MTEAVYCFYNSTQLCLSAVDLHEREATMRLQLAKLRKAGFVVLILYLNDIRSEKLNLAFDRSIYV